MKPLQALLRDRRQAQGGSVLSAVLIIVMLLSILCGALATELSTTFLLSRNLMNRAANEATVNSAVELSLSNLQSASQLNSQCPALPPSVNVNLRIAVPTYSSCWPTVYEPSKFKPLAPATKPFSLDGTHALAGLDDYVIGNPDGTVFDYRFGFSSYRWKLTLNGSVTGTPLVMPDPQNGGQYIDVIPLAGAFCSPSATCLELRSDDLSGSPTHACTIPTSAVVSQLAASPTGAVYYGDGANLSLIDLSNDDCPPVQSLAIPGPQPVVKGLAAFRCTNGCGRSTDEVYALVSDSGSSSLIQFSYRRNLTLGRTLNLPIANPIGLDTSGSSMSAGVSVAISFQSGGIALVRIASDGTQSLAATASVPSTVGDAPYWCVQCGNVIGIGGQNGRLYLLDALLNPHATYAGASARINTTPQADGAGNWYYGADDGYVYEVQVQPGQALMTFANRYGPMAKVGSSVQVGGCNLSAPAPFIGTISGICVYLGGLNGTSYLIPLDARAAVLSACVSISPPQCSGENPRLWAQIEALPMSGQQAVNVLGWSYYSP